MVSLFLNFLFYILEAKKAARKKLSLAVNILKELLNLTQLRPTETNELIIKANLLLLPLFVIDSSSFREIGLRTSSNCFYLLTVPNTILLP